jgi:hypothetical protein
LIYVADAAGYVGSIGLLLAKNFANIQLAWEPFFIQSAYAVGLIGFIGVCASALYFRKRLTR